MQSPIAMKPVSFLAHCMDKESPLHGKTQLDFLQERGFIVVRCWLYQTLCVASLVRAMSAALHGQGEPPARQDPARYPPRARLHCGALQCSVKREYLLFVVEMSIRSSRCRHAGTSHEQHDLQAASCLHQTDVLERDVGRDLHQCKDRGHAEPTLHQARG